MTGNSDGRRPDRAAFVIALGLAALGAILIREGYAIPNKAGYAGVGSGDIPWLIGLCLLALAAGTVISGLRGGLPDRAPQHLGPVGWILAGFLAPLFFVHSVGFVLTMTVLFACSAAGFGEKRFHLSLPLGLVLSAVVYAMFDLVLNLNLPGGPLERLIFGG